MAIAAPRSTSRARAASLLVLALAACFHDSGGGGPSTTAATSEAATGGATTATTTSDASGPGSDGSGSGASTTATTGASTSTTEEAGGTKVATGGTGGLCDAVHKLPLAAADAALEGPWALVESMAGEGEILQYMGAPDEPNAVTWTVDIPCQDTWSVWVRGFDNLGSDTFLVQVEGEPEPPGLFELDCTADGDSYLWRALNLRDPRAGLCEYLADPWRHPWGQGPHELRFSHHAAPALVRAIVINDPDFVPGPMD